MKKNLFFVVLFYLSFFLVFTTCFMCFYSCRSLPPEGLPEEITGGPELSRELIGEGLLNADELSDFFCKNNSSANRKHIKKFAQIYIDEARAENINSDVAFAQMCHETGFLNFGNLVVPEMHNYCGLGAMDSEHRGEWFESEKIGVRAHIQHLQAYATTPDVTLTKELVDPRYSWPHKAKLAHNVYDLAGSWATDPDYGKKLDRLLSQMQECKER